MADPVYERFEDPVDGTVWNIDTAFLGSNWMCIWGKGCKGILSEPAEHLNQGCCSHGAQFLDEEEAMNIGALAMTLDADRFQFHDVAATTGIYGDTEHTLTRVVDGACIFHNRPDFPGGEGCALHLAALDARESPTTWKPSVCWQLPLRVDVETDRSRTLRRWARSDWDDDQSTIAWCCTEEPEPYTSEDPVAESLAEELTAMVGPEVHVQIRERIASKTASGEV